MPRAAAILSFRGKREAAPTDDEVLATVYSSLVFVLHPPQTIRVRFISVGKWATLPQVTIFDAKTLGF